MSNDNDSKAVSFRQYPAISLQAALAAAKDINTKEKRTVLSYDAAAKACGHASLSGPARQKIASLRKYGLLDGIGDGIQISQLALRLLHQPESTPDYQAALKEAALSPELFRKLLPTHADASPDAVTSHLILKLQFSQEGAKVAAKAFKETIAFAKLNASSYTPETDENKTRDQSEKGASGPGATPFGLFGPKPPAPSPPKHPQQPMNTATIQPGEASIPVAGNFARVPFPMTEEDFEMFIGTLQLWKKKLVKAVTPNDRQYPAQAIWKNNDFDKPVNIVGEMGDRDGQKYYQSEDGTGIPGSELWFNS